MLDDAETLKMWVSSVPEFSQHTVEFELLQTYKEWLKEHFP